MFKNLPTSKSTSNLRTYDPDIIIVLKQKQETNAFCIKKKKMSKLLKWKNIFKASLNRQILSTRNYIIISKERKKEDDYKRFVFNAGHG